MLETGASLVPQIAKNSPAMQEMLVRSLSHEVFLGKEMATHSSIVHGKSHGQRNLVGYSPWDRKESDRSERLILLPHVRNKGDKSLKFMSS